MHLGTGRAGTRTGRRRPTTRRCWHWQRRAPCGPILPSTSSCRWAGKRRMHPSGADCIPLGAECIPPGASALSPDRAPSGHRAAALETSRAASPLALQPSSTSSRVGAAVAVSSSTAPVAEATAGSEVGCGGCSGKTAPRERERSLSTYLETGSVLIEAATDTEQVAAAMATLAPLVPGLHYFRSPPPPPPPPPATAMWHHMSARLGVPASTSSPVAPPRLQSPDDQRSQ